MMKFFPNSSKKGEKGQVLVIVALVFVALVAIIGLAVDSGYMYVSYSRLRRGVDAAALAGTGEFRIPDALIDDPSTQGHCLSACITQRDTKILAAVQQMLDLNEIEPDPAAGFTGPMSTTPGLSIETCGNTPTDTTLCATPLQKVIRVRVQVKVPLFFLAVVGLHEVPISVESIASAASADVMLTMDVSDSMTYGDANNIVPPGSVMRDPHACNPDDCQPMKQVKVAAGKFADRLYYPYDRLGLVTFDQYATMKLPLSDDSTNDIHAAIDAITVFEGVQSGPLTDGTPTGTKCIYYAYYKNIDPATTGGSDLSYPWAYNPDAGYWDLNDRVGDQKPPQKLVETGPAVTYPIDTVTGQPTIPDGPCRLFDEESGSFLFMDCPRDYGPDGTPARCGTTNIGGAVDMGTRALTGVYPASVTSPPASRDDSVPVLVLLTDGAANAAYDSTGHELCPEATWQTSCRDPNANTRHTNPLDPNFDAQDQPRYMFDIALNNEFTIFTIGLGGLVTNIPSYATGPAPGETLLKYPEITYPSLGGYAKYFFAPTSTDLYPIFTEIANLISSRINP